MLIYIPNAAANIKQFRRNANFIRIRDPGERILRILFESPEANKQK